MPASRIKDRLYLDTSVISVYHDVRDPFLQQETRQFWTTLDRYDTYISDVVTDEIAAAPLRIQGQLLALIGGFFTLSVDAQVRSLAQAYLDAGIFTPRKINDALHVAVATIHRLDYLVSWNFHDLVRVRTRRLVNLVNTQQDYATVEIVAPSEL